MAVTADTADTADTAEPSTAPHPFEVARAAGREPFKVRDLAQADFGRKEIRLAEQEMPGLMALRTQHAGGARSPGRGSWAACT